MTVQVIIQREFSEQDLVEMAVANRRLGKLYKGAHLDDWLAYIPKLTAIRTAALHAAHTNNMRDRRYGIALKEIMHQLLPKFLDGEIVRAEATHLMWLGEEAERLTMLTEYREGLAPAQHVALATPKGARNAVQRMIASREVALAAAAIGTRRAADEVQRRPAGQLQTKESDAEIVLSTSAEEKLQAKLRAHQKRLDLEAECKAQQEATRMVNEMSIPNYLETVRRLERMLSWPRNAVMSKAEYNTLLRCVHPDGLKTRTEPQLAEAFRILTHYKLKMVSDEDERRRTLSTLPQTVEELLARKKRK